MSTTDVGVLRVLLTGDTGAYEKEMGAASTITKKLQTQINSFNGDTLIRQAQLAADAIAKMGGTSTLTASQLDRVGKQAAAAAEKLKLLGRDVPSGIAALAKAIDPVPEKLNLAGKAADSVKTSFAQMFGAFTAGSIVERVLTGAVTGLVNLGKGAFESAGQISDLATKTGASVEAIQRWTAAGKGAGVEAETFATASFKLSTRLAAGSTNITVALEQLGLSAEKVRQLNPEQQLNAIVGALGKVGDASERNALGVSLFGKVFESIAPAVTADFERMAAAADVSTQAQIDALDRAGDKWAEFQNTVGTSVRSTLGNLVNFSEQAAKLSIWQKLGLLAVSGDPLRLLIDAGSTTPKGDTPPSSVKTETPPRDFARELAEQVKAVRALTEAQRAQLDAAIKINTADEDYLSTLGLTTAGLKIYTEAKQKDAKLTQEAATKTERAYADLAKTQAQFFGYDKIAAAQKMVDAIGGLAGVALGDAKEVAKLHTAIQEAIDAGMRLGVDVPLEWVEILHATQPVLQTTEDWIKALGKVPAAMAEIQPPPALKDPGMPWSLTSLESLRQASAGVQKFADSLRSANEAGAGGTNPDFFAITPPPEQSWTRFFDVNVKGLDQMARSFEMLANVAGDSMSSIVRQIGTLVASMAMASDAGSDFATSRAGKKNPDGSVTRDWGGMATAGIQGAAAIMQATGSGSRGARVGGGALAGWSMGNKIVPVFGGIVGAGVGALAGIFRGSSDGERINDGRDDFLKSLTGIADKGGAQKSFREIATAAGIADAAVTRFLTERNEGRFNAQLAEITAQLEQQDAAAIAFGQSFPKTLDLVASSGALVSAEFQGVIDRMTGMGAATEEIGAFVTGQITSAVTGINALVTGSAITTQQSATGVTAALAASFGELTARGMSAREAIQALAPTIGIVEEQLAAAGVTGGAAWDQVRNMATIAADETRGPLLDAIHGGIQALVGLQNAGILDQEMFTGLSGQVSETFANLIAQGTDGRAALQLIGPDIQRLWELQHDFGYEVDAATQALIDQGAEAGLVGEAHRDAQDKATKAMQEAADAMKEVGKTLERVFGTAATEGEDFAARVRNAIETIPRNVGIDVTTTHRDVYGDPGDVERHHTGGLIMHAGGLVPRLHEGGFPGLAFDEVPAILQTGERVLSRQQNRAYEASSGARVVTTGGDTALLAAVNGLRQDNIALRLQIVSLHDTIPMAISDAVTLGRARL